MNVHRVSATLINAWKYTCGCTVEYHSETSRRRGSEPFILYRSRGNPSQYVYIVPDKQVVLNDFQQAGGNTSFVTRWRDRILKAIPEIRV